MPNHHRTVVYLIGAGGSHASIRAVGSSRGILMRHLTIPLATAARALVTSDDQYAPLANVVNEIIDDADFEHLITFFGESPSALDRHFANELRRIFETVLVEQLSHIEHELGPERLALYSALLDMYNVAGINERLQGILTLNYDDYIEDAAAAVCLEPPTFGIATADTDTPGPRLPLLKLHGSFGWHDAWPVRSRELTHSTAALWIPPGIRKAKERYPFNLVWGRAREILNCDLLRVVGCKLGPSDWDLISLLFSTRHSNAARPSPYAVEVIDSPEHAADLKGRYPYLDIRSILEIDTHDIGSYFVSEITSGPPRRFADLSREEARQVVTASARLQLNWFHMWLVQMAEGLHRDLGPEATATPSGALRRLLEV